MALFIFQQPRVAKFHATSKEEDTCGIRFHVSYLIFYSYLPLSRHLRIGDHPSFYRSTTLFPAILPIDHPLSRHFTDRPPSFPPFSRSTTLFPANTKPELTFSVHPQFFVSHAGFLLTYLESSKKRKHPRNYTLLSIYSVGLPISILNNYLYD
jgi:hypothetical protein